MKVTVQLDKAKINKLIAAQQESIEKTADAVKTEIVNTAVVPKNKGELERSGYVDHHEFNKGIAKIVFNMPYARRLYWHPEYNFRHDKNTNAQGKWMQSYIDGPNKNFASDTFKKNLKECSGGLIK